MFGRKLLKSAVVTTITAATLLAPLAGDAFAKDGGRRERPRTKIAKVQKECSREAARVQHHFTELANAITNSAHLTSAHKTTLNTGVSADSAAVTDAKAALDASTTLDAARRACRDLKTLSRALRFDVAKARLTSKADRVDAGINAIQALLDQATVMVDQLEANGQDVSTYRAMIAEAQATLDGIESDASGMGDAIAALMMAEGVSATIEADAATLHDAVDGLTALAQAIEAASGGALTPPGDGGASN